MKKRRVGIAPQPALIAVGLSFAALISMSGCASSAYPTVPAGVANQTQSTTSGTVLATRTVVIDGEAGYLGVYGGAIMGGAIGQTVGSGTGRAIASATGTVVGGMVGAKAQEELTKKVAQELTIGLDDGHTIVVVQELEQPGFIEGDRVTVMETRSGAAYVTHAHYQVDGIYFSHLLR